MIVEKIDKAKLESRLDLLSHLLARLEGSNEVKELIREIRKPGWTKPVEYFFTLGLVDTMIAQVKVVDELKTVLVNGVKAINVEKPAEVLVS